MNKYIETVREFHEVFNHPINEVNQEIPLNVRQLRVKLIFEELQELSVASDVTETFLSLCQEVINKKENIIDGDNVNKVEELDALCDLQYVLSGGIISLGHSQNFDKAFENVHDSNMSKMCSNMKEALDTIQFYVSEKGETESNMQIKPKGTKYIVSRVSDNKILKNVYYKKTNLNPYV